jgi:hypothetical protein
MLTITGNLLNSDTDAEDYYVVTIEGEGELDVGGDSTRVRYDVKAGTAMDPTELTISGDLNMLGTTPTDSEQLIDVRSDSLFSVGGNIVNGRFDIRGSNTTVDVNGSVMGPDGLVWGLSSVTATVDGDVSEGAALNGKGLVIFSGSTDATFGTSGFIDGETITPTVESTETNALKLWLLDSADISTATSVVEGGSDNLVVAIAGNSSIFRTGTERYDPGDDVCLGRRRTAHHGHRSGQRGDEVGLRPAQPRHQPRRGRRVSRRAHHQLRLQRPGLARRYHSRPDDRSGDQVRL